MQRQGPMQVSPIQVSPVRGTWSRRQFLAITGTTALGALAAACSRSVSATEGPPAGTAAYRSRPDLHPPLIKVERKGQPAGGYVFVTPGGPLIVADDGEPVWVRPVPNAATNLQVQSYRGQPVLTWWQGEIAHYGVGLEGECLLVDSTYAPVATVRAGNGLQADLHEFVLTDAGTAYLTAYSPVTADLSVAQGPSRGTMLDAAVQEVDVATGNVLFEWRSTEHIDIDESYTLYSPSSPYDPVHLNSIQVLADGNLLLSARNTWALYKVDRATGDILWRLGGKKSDFKLGDGVRFAWQHHARQHPDGTITLFDDEAAPPERPASRGLMLHVDEKTMEAHLVRSYVHPGQRVLAGSQGSVQLLAGGDVFVGWGAEPYYTEFRRDGTLVLDAQFETGSSYRAFRFPWRGTPGGRPDLAAVRQRSAGGPGTVTLYTSWNGATEVSQWRVLGGTGPGALAEVARRPRSGFETSVQVDGSSTNFATQALDATGAVLGTSRVVRA